MTKFLLIIACVVVLLVAILVATYNTMVNRSQAVDGQWAQVQNVYARRADLIPNLVATVSGAANFEKTTLTEITRARASVGQVNTASAQAPTDSTQLNVFQKAQDGLGSALSRLLVVSERYPDLRATANFRDLQAQLEGTENRITIERQKFNDVVQSYNTTVRGFPGIMMAGLFGFSPKPYFSAQAGAGIPPKVDFITSAGSSVPARP